MGSHLIARRLRRHVHAYYDFVRAADDVSDSAELSPEEKIRRLDLMEAALRGAPGATSSSAARLRPTLAATGLPPELATDLLIAFRRDATVLRTPDWAALLDYCRYSANPVGRFLLALHGENETTYAASDALCTSLQILNHLQDCAEDFRLLDRSYLPGDMLADADITAGEVLQHRTRPALRHVFDRILDRVDRLNVEAARLPGLVRNRRMRIEAAVIVGLAHRLAARLRVEDPLAGRVKLQRDDVRGSLRTALRHLPTRIGPLGCAPADIAAVEATVAQAGTSFGAGMRILPADRRLAMHAIYAFCRIVDDIADDEAAPLAGRREALAAWRLRIGRLYAGEAHAQDARLRHDTQDARLQHDTQDARLQHDTQDARLQHDTQDARLQHDTQDARLQHDTQDARLQHDTQDARLQHDMQDARLRHDTQDARLQHDALDRVLRAAIRRYDLRRVDFEAVIDGMETDAATTVVAPSLAALDLYCDRVAAAVGRLSVRAFGDRGAAAAEVAHHLGRALQLTNILRDLEEDRARGRLYLPREYLAAEGVPPNPDAALSHPALRQVCGRVVVDARHHFAAAERAMRRANGRAMRPARVMAATYAALLQALEDPAWVPGERVRLSRRRKIAVAAAALLRR